MDHTHISKEISDFIRQNDNFLITSHHAPDGDNIGACAGIYTVLNEMGKKAVIVNDDKFVERYRFLFDGIDFPFVQYSESMNFDKFTNVIILDTATYDRIGKVKNIISETAVIVNIDHHPANGMFGTINLVDQEQASASQIIYMMLRSSNIKVSKRTADALLSGILSDTGGLRYENSDIQTVKIVAELMELGADLSDITDRIFLRLSYEETLKVSEITSKIVLFKEEKIAVAYNDQQINPLLENEPVLMILNSIEEAKVSLFVRKNGDNFFKISLRSKGDFNVSEFSAKWAGGGHKNAAGIKFKGTYNEFEDTILKELKTACRNFHAGS